MHLRHVLVAILVVAAMVMAGSAGAQAQTVGRLTQLEGRVELLKGGNLPAIPLKLEDTVAPGDVVRTKSLSKVQITFIDNSTLTLSQESRVAIEEFSYEPAREQRHAVLQVFQGLALAVVNKIIKTEEPDFVVKTQTAVMGVRGTEFGIRNQPNSSTILNFSGSTQVGNIFPEVSRLFLKAFKVAFTFGPWNDGSRRWVLLGAMQGTTVAQNLPPTQPFGLTNQDRDMFMRQLTTYISSQGQQPAGTPVASRGGDSGVPLTLNTPGAQTTIQNLTTVTVPPTLVPKIQQPAPVTPIPSHTEPTGGSGTYFINSPGF
jgi:hypothetical protein